HRPRSSYDLARGPVDGDGDARVLDQVEDRAAAFHLPTQRGKGTGVLELDPGVERHLLKVWADIRCPPEASGVHGRLRLDVQLAYLDPLLGSDGLHDDSEAAGQRADDILHRGGSAVVAPDRLRLGSVELEVPHPVPSTHGCLPHTA